MAEIGTATVKVVPDMTELEKLVGRFGHGGTRNIMIGVVHHEEVKIERDEDGNVVRETRRSWQTFDEPAE